MEKIKKFLDTKLGQQIYSFVKTYITVFLGIYLTLQAVMADPNISAMQDINLIDVNIIALSAKGAFISILRNVYKLLTEKDAV